MRIAMPAVNRRLPELVYQTFAGAPGYLIHDDATEALEYIDNQARHAPSANGAAAATVLAGLGVDTAITGHLEDRCLEQFRAHGIEVFAGFVGTCEQAIEAHRTGNLSTLPPVAGDTPPRKLASFDFIDVTHTFSGDNIVYADWDFIRPLTVAEGLPLDWTAPVDYANGYYHLQVEATTPHGLGLPIELEFGFFNLPPAADADRLERCSFGQYCRIPTNGTWRHLALMEDMELTTTAGDEKRWDWTHAWFEPFVLIKPFEQAPYPFRIDLLVTIIEAEPR